MDLKFAIVQIATKIDIKNEISKKKWMQWRFDIKITTPAAYDDPTAFNLKIQPFSLTEINNEKTKK